MKIIFTIKNNNGNNKILKKSYKKTKSQNMKRKRKRNTQALPFT